MGLNEKKPEELPQKEEGQAAAQVDAEAAPDKKEEVLNNQQLDDLLDDLL